MRLRAIRAAAAVAALRQRLRGEPRYSRDTRRSLDHCKLTGSFLDHGVQAPRILHMATLGKALGGYGAFVSGAAPVIEWLMQRARTYMYSTALPPMTAAVATAAVEMLEEDGS